VSAVTTPLAERRAAGAGREEAVELPRASALGRLVGLYIASVLVALLITALLVLVVGHSPWSVFSAIWTGSLSTPGAVGQTVDDMLPVLLVALGTLVSVRAGMFNIGQTGQLLMGATGAAFVTLKLHGPGAPILLLALLASVAGGALWAGIAALLRVWRRIDVVISTLLLVYVATQLLAWLVSSEKLLEEPPPVGGLAGALPQSALLPAKFRLPHLFGEYPSFGVSLGVVIVLGLFAILAVLLSRSAWGVRLRMVGANAVAARRFGVNVAAVAAGALVICGALSGLAGGVMVTGEVFRIQAGFDNNFGNDGLLAALVVRDRPGALIPVAILFAVIRTGGNFLLATGVPNYLAQVLEGLIVLAFVFPPVYLERREWARRLKAARALALRSAP
jgi:simple sugar transport system permease protein